MEEVLLMKIDGARLSACQSGLFFDCEAGTILILWEQIVAAQQKFAPDEATATVKCISCDNDVPRPICESCL